MKNLKFLALLLIPVLLFIGCDLDSVDSMATYRAEDVIVGGDIYDGVTGQDIVAAAKAKDIKVYVSYPGTYEKAAVVKYREAAEGAVNDGGSVEWSTTVPNGVTFQIRVVDESGTYVEFYANEVMTAGDAESTITERTEGVEKVQAYLTRHIPLYPITGVNVDRTYTLRDADSQDILSTATGNFRAEVTPTGGSPETSGVSTRGNDFDAIYVNKSITGDIVNGSFVLEGDQLIYGATYTITVFNVDGYVNDTVGTYVAGNAAIDTVTYFDLTNNVAPLALEIIDVSWLDADGKVKDGETVFAITFNQNVELYEANAKDYVTLANITLGTAGDTDGLPVEFSSPDGASQMATPGPVIEGVSYAATNHSTTTGDGTATITVTVDGTVNSEGQTDDYGFTIQLNELYVRPAVGNENSWSVVGTNPAGGPDLTFDTKVGTTVFSIQRNENNSF